MSRPPRIGLRALLCASLVTVALNLPALAEFELPYVIKAKSIVTAPGQVLENASIVVRQGIIVEVGTDVSVPKGAKILTFENLTIYPGLIESYHGRSFPDSADDDDGGDDGESVELGHQSDLVQPERNAASAKLSEDDVKKLRNAGFTMAVGVPDKGIFRGGAILQTLGAGSLQDNLLRTRVGQSAGLDQSTGGDFPTSLMGSMAMFRQVISDARWYTDATAKYDRDPAQRKPTVNLSLAALQRVVEGDQVLLFETTSAKSALRVLALLAESDLKAYLLGNGKEYERLDEILSGGFPILLPVDFPSAPSVEGGEDASVTDTLKPSLGELRHWKAAPSNPAKLVGAGATVAFTTHELGSPSDIFSNLAKAIEHGLTKDQALAGLTTVPAKLYGVDGIAGTLEVGKMANFILAEGDLFVEKPKIQEVWVNGARYEFEEIKAPEINPIGKWEVKVNAGGQTIEAKLTVSGSMESLKGELEVMGMTLPVSDVTVSGKTVILTIDTAAVGMPGEMTMRFTVDGDTAKGSGDGPMGAFSFTAKRTSTTPGAEGLQQ